MVCEGREACAEHSLRATTLGACALAKHGDLTGAAAKFQLANQKGPHWADPLKAWGDVLMKQDNAKDALAKYDEALKYAPNWKQLKEAREAAAKLKT